MSDDEDDATDEFEDSASDVELTEFIFEKEEELVEQESPESTAVLTEESTEVLGEEKQDLKPERSEEEEQQDERYKKSLSILMNVLYKNRAVFEAQGYIVTRDKNNLEIKHKDDPENYSAVVIQITEEDR